MLRARLLPQSESNALNVQLKSIQPPSINRHFRSDLRPAPPPSFPSVSVTPRPGNPSSLSLAWDRNGVEIGDCGPVEKPLRRRRTLPANQPGEPQSVSHHHNLGEWAASSTGPLSLIFRLLVVECILWLDSVIVGLVGESNLYGTVNEIGGGGYG